MMVNLEPIIISVHGAGKERGTRIYFIFKALKRIKENFGENFFLFNNKKLVAHLDPINETIMISSLNSANSTSNNPQANNSLDFIESIEDEVELDY